MKLFNKNTKAGFTLVELIVVIAILGILAGIAIPTYSGYIKKANQAADNTLLSAINTAFGAACLENGVDSVSLTDATLAYDNTGENLKITGLSAALPDTEDKGIVTSFAKYFAGNEGTLKYYEQGDIFFYQGAFTTDLSAAFTKAVANYTNSNFYGHEAQLLTSVESLTNVFGDWLPDESKPIDQRMNALSALGLDDDARAAFIAKYGLTDESSNTAIANALVLEVANRSKNVDPYALLSAVQTEGTGAILSGDLMTNLPLAYGLITAYANSTYASDDFKTYYNSATLSAGLSNNGAVYDGETLVTPENTDSLMTLMNYFMAEGDEKLNGYLTNNALNDMNGYLGAMTAISQNADQVNINDEHAINNSEILALIQQFLNP